MLRLQQNESLPSKVVCCQSQGGGGLAPQFLAVPSFARPLHWLSSSSETHFSEVIRKEKLTQNSSEDKTGFLAAKSVHKKSKTCPKTRIHIFFRKAQILSQHCLFWPFCHFHGFAFLAKKSKRTQNRWYTNFGVPASKKCESLIFTGL